MTRDINLKLNEADLEQFLIVLEEIAKMKLNSRHSEEQLPIYIEDYEVFVDIYEQTLSQVGE